ncbi:hypothetical protein REPUB_Repub03eG0097700 [Reevesia pubescens]
MLFLSYCCLCCRFSVFFLCSGFLYFSCRTDSGLSFILFDTLSGLKSAYVKLQEAHIPYNPAKIIATDELVVYKLETLCMIKRAYKEKQFSKLKLDSSSLELLRSDVEVNERLLEKLKSENKTKDMEIVRLKEELQDSAFRNAKLVEIIRRERMERKNARVLDVIMFQNSFKAASKSIRDFAKPLIISLMMASGWDLDLAAKSIDNGVAYARRPHKKYAFEAYIAWRMFHGMLLESYNVNDIMKFDDPIDALIENPNSEQRNRAKNPREEEEEENPRGIGVFF